MRLCEYGQTGFVQHYGALIAVSCGVKGKLNAGLTEPLISLALCLMIKFNGVIGYFINIEHCHLINNFFFCPTKRFTYLTPLEVI